MLNHKGIAAKLSTLATASALVLAGGSACSNETDGGGGSAVNDCVATNVQGVAACVDQGRYEADLNLVTGVRSPGTPQHQAVQDLCAKRFEENGFTVEIHNYGTGTNVIGVLPGTTDERVLLSAHYDAVPGCAGADDNGTGVAGVLEAARVLGKRSYQRTLVLACWDEEELGLLGSRAYATRAQAQGENIAGVFVYEMIGFRSDAADSQTLPFGFDAIFPDASAEVAANDNRGDFIAIIGDESMQGGIDSLNAFGTTFGVSMIEVTLIEAFKNDANFSDLQRSDHAPFWAIGVPALHMTDTANFRNPYYHCAAGDDAVADLDMTFASGTVRASIAAVTDMLGLQ